MRQHLTGFVYNGYCRESDVKEVVKGVECDVTCFVPPAHANGRFEKHTIYIPHVYSGSVKFTASLACNMVRSALYSNSFIPFFNRFQELDSI